MNGKQLIDKFHLYAGDSSELSTADELLALNQAYAQIMAERPWEILKKSASGSIMAADDGTPYIPLPDDFRMFAENSQGDEAGFPKAVFMGPTYTPYRIISWSDRRQFAGQNHVCYPDLQNSRILFAVAPAETSYEFDYVSRWEDVTLSTEPIFPSEWHDIIPRLMAVDAMVMSLFDKARSYARENQAAAESQLRQMRLWNANQRMD